MPPHFRRPGSDPLRQRPAVGGFPFEQTIKSITKIENFSDKNVPDAAVVIGLRINNGLLNGSTPTITRGIANVDKVGS